MKAKRPDSKSDILAALERSRRAGLPKARKAETRLRALVGKLPRGFFDVGVALAAFREERHALFLGHRAFDKYLAASGLLRRATAYKLLSIVRHVPRARANALGLERAYAISRIAARDPRAAKAATLDALSSRELTRRARHRGPASNGTTPLAERLVALGYPSATARSIDGRLMIALSYADARRLARKCSA
jgi:hypothetical protein